MITSRMFIAPRAVLFLIVLLITIFSLYYCQQSIQPFSVLKFASKPSLSIFDVPKPSVEGIIPKIREIYFGAFPLGGLGQSVLTWITRNRDYSYTLMRDKGTDVFFRHLYANRLDFLRVFLSLNVPVLQSDLLRYMILVSLRGIYSDVDTSAERPSSIGYQKKSDPELAISSV